MISRRYFTVSPSTIEFRHRDPRALLCGWFRVLIMFSSKTRKFRIGSTKRRMEYGYAFRTSHHPTRDSKETNATARMNAPPSRSIFRSHATRGASATLFALALVFFRRIHAAEREAVRATRFNARDFCEQASTRELEPWNNHKKVLSFSLFAPSSEDERSRAHVDPTRTSDLVLHS